MRDYKIREPMTLPEVADSRYADLSHREAERGFRVIGGDQGDLHFQGYVVEGEQTRLWEPVLHTAHDDLTGDEAINIANDILLASFASIGIEAVEHS